MRGGCGLDSLGMEHSGQQGFPCSLWHPSLHRLEAAVLGRPLEGPADQALEGGLCRGQLLQLPELPVGPALPPLSVGGAMALGGGVAWLCVVGSWGLVAVVGLGESS